MRNVTLVLVMLVAGAAGAQKGNAKGAVAAATAVLDKADEAFNAHDAKALEAMLDKGWFGEGATVSAKFENPEAFKAHLEQMAAQGGHMTRDGLMIKADDDGDTAWYVADYTFIPKVPPGALPVHRKMRESGVLVRHGKDWKFALWHMSQVQLDPTPPPPPAQK